ncbi:hypothetical protein [Ottowia sp.]|uniref:hypothetical protein n=1 Tax=Ottowia sp. TaxID=1898956 RepID=UPI0025E63A5D|nr:hypothetical protein [Ottowia sp.]MBK6616339.1 hypothetical protein [Ottowia sp.]
MDKVVITKRWLGLGGMQVCASRDATDKEILAVCNADNPAAIEAGWSTVVRSVDEPGGAAGRHIPVACEANPGRVLLVVLC